MTTKLAAQTQKTAGIPNGMRTATIKAVTSTAITISLSGGSFSSGVGVVGSYTPHVGDVVAVFRQDSSWLILGLTSSVGGMASRRVATAPAIADATATSGTTEMVYETISFPAVAGQTYHIRSYFPFSGSVASDKFLVRLRTGTTAAGAQITYATAMIYATATVFVVTPEDDWTASATGTASFCVTAQLNSGSGTLTAKGATSQTRLLTADYIAF